MSVSYEAVFLNPLLAKQGLDILQLMENNQINENNIRIQGEQY